MRGFEDYYVDIVDYIIRATRCVWEEHDVSDVCDIYRHDFVIRGQPDLVFGRDPVIKNSFRLLGTFSDMRWRPRDVIWAGDDESDFHIWHRSIFVGTNTSWSQFGPLTVRCCTFMAIANCVTMANEIMTSG